VFFQSFVFITFEIEPHSFEKPVSFANINRIARIIVRKAHNDLYELSRFKFSLYNVFPVKRDLRWNRQRAVTVVKRRAARMMGRRKRQRDAREIANARWHEDFAMVKVAHAENNSTLALIVKRNLSPPRKMFRFAPIVVALVPHRFRGGKGRAARLAHGFDLRFRFDSEENFAHGDNLHGRPH
jgi:hypothetical protein